MIRHICMFKLKEENKQETLSLILEKSKTITCLPTIHHAEVHVNSPEAPQDNYEIALVFDFETWDDLETYRVHPAHVAFGQFMRTVHESRACVDYMI